jgi:hypothetical protein
MIVTFPNKVKLILLQGCTISLIFCFFSSKFNFMRSSIFKFKLCQYVDDAHILLDGSEKSVRNTVKLLIFFSQISGLKVNYSKSELAPH